MPMLENNDERVQNGLRELGQALSRFVTNFVSFDQSLVDRVDYIVKDHASKFKAEHGYEFPPLGLCVLPSARFIICCRRHLDDAVIHNQLLMWLRQVASKGVHPSAIEVAVAIRRCWPGYKPPIESYRKDTKSKIILH